LGHEVHFDLFINECYQMVHRVDKHCQ
jgi:hypothetical protein